jgi:anti-sigma regulatory factor (Ser/Thr protein kinase)
VSVRLVPKLDLMLGECEGPDLRLLMLSRAENVALVRRAIEGLALALDIDPAVTVDIVAATSEACNNVVLHAYGGRPGLLELHVCPDHDELCVTVRDEGTGIRPRPLVPASSPGVGLSMIHALTDSVEFRGSHDGGTEVRMTFDTGRPMTKDIPDVVGDRQISPPSGELVVSVASGALAEAVLSRVLAMTASRANFAVDRVNDVQLVSDAIAAHAPATSVGRHLHIALDPGTQAFGVKVGPFQSGGAEALLSASSIGETGLELLEELTVERRVEPDLDGEVLSLSIAG